VSLIKCYFDILCDYLFIVAAANHTQRRADDDDINMNLLSPDKSRIAQRAAKRQHQGFTGNVSALLSRIKERK
jgi:hypothetical protein